MKKRVWLLALILGAGGQVGAKTGWYGNMATGPLWDIAISPSEPTAMDTVHVTISHVVWGCKYVEIVSVSIVGNEIWVAADVLVDDRWNTSIGGGSWAEDTRSLGVLKPGTYTVYVGDRDTGSYDASLSFTVAPTGPGMAIQDRWDALGGCICQRWPAMLAGKPCPFCGRDSSDATDSGNTGSLLDDLRQRLGSFWRD